MRQQCPRSAEVIRLTCLQGLTCSNSFAWQPFSLSLPQALCPVQTLYTSKLCISSYWDPIVDSCKALSPVSHAACGMAVLSSINVLYHP